MRSRMAVSVVGVVLALALCGCAVSNPPSASVDTGQTSQEAQVRLDASQAQVNALQELIWAINVTNAPEPRSDASLHDLWDATYMAVVDEVSTGTAAPSMVLDFVTDGYDPSLDAVKRRTSAMRFYRGWNKWKHPQRFPIATDATIVIPIGSGTDILALSPSEFSARKDRGYLHDVRYYVQFTGDGITDMWPIPVR